MNRLLSTSHSGNPKSAIQNPKWLGLTVIALVLVVVVAVAQAQQPPKVPRIGWLTGGGVSVEAGEAFRQGLRELGYIEGKNIAIEWRVAEGKRDRVPALAAELVRLKVDVIVTGSATDTRAAKAATVTIPIVMTNDGDPVGNGFVFSLARPGGNITGLSTLSPEISGKRLELLKEIVPKALPCGRIRDFDKREQRTRVKRSGACGRALRAKASIPRCARSQGY
jgi:putative ABC transport system substrate-binding protein